MLERRFSCSSSKLNFVPIGSTQKKKPPAALRLPEALRLSRPRYYMNLAMPLSGQLSNKKNRPEITDGP